MKATRPANPESTSLPERPGGNDEAGAARDGFRLSPQVRKVMKRWEKTGRLKPRDIYEGVDCPDPEDYQKWMGVPPKERLAEFRKDCASGKPGAQSVLDAALQLHAKGFVLTADDWVKDGISLLSAAGWIFYPAEHALWKVANNLAAHYKDVGLAASDREVEALKRAVHVGFQIAELASFKVPSGSGRKSKLEERFAALDRARERLIAEKAPEQKRLKAMAPLRELYDKEMPSDKGKRAHWFENLVSKWRRYRGQGAVIG